MNRVVLIATLAACGQPEHPKGPPPLLVRATCVRVANTLVSSESRDYREPSISAKATSDIDFSPLENDPIIWNELFAHAPAFRACYDSLEPSPKLFERILIIHRGEPTSTGMAPAVASCIMNELASIHFSVVADFAIRISFANAKIFAPLPVDIHGITDYMEQPSYETRDAFAGRDDAIRACLAHEPRGWASFAIRSSPGAKPTAAGVAPAAAACLAELATTIPTTIEEGEDCGFAYGTRTPADAPSYDIDDDLAKLEALAPSFRPADLVFTQGPVTLRVRDTTRMARVNAAMSTLGRTLTGYSFAVGDAFVGRGAKPVPPFISAWPTFTASAFVTPTRIWYASASYGESAATLDVRDDAQLVDLASKERVPRARPTRLETHFVLELAFDDGLPFSRVREITARLDAAHIPWAIFPPKVMTVNPLR